MMEFPQRETDLARKTCRLCNETKVPDEFYASEQKQNRPRCKVCMRENASRQRQERNAAKAASPAKPKPKRGRAKPVSVSPEQLMKTLAGEDRDPVFEVIGGIVETQKLMLELLRERS